MKPSNVPRFRGPYGPKYPSGIVCGGGRTEQSHKDECDINQILLRFQRNGLLDHVQEHGASYADIQPVTYHEAMNTIATANSMFADLPSSIREKFDNSPAKFLEYVQDPSNEQALIDLGLADAKPKPVPTQVEIINPVDQTTETASLQAEPAPADK